MKDLMKMIESKKDDKMEEGDYSAKSEMLMELIKMASAAAGEDIKKGLDGEMQEVTVAAPDEEGLMEGLEMAEEVVEEGPEALMPEDGEMMESEDDMEEEMSPEEIEAEIQRLMEMKSKLGE